MDAPDRPVWLRFYIEPPYMEPRGPACFSPKDWPPSNGCPPGSRVLDAAVLPGLCNSHLHLLDAAFPEHGETLSLHELVAQPGGLKYRLLLSARERRLLPAARAALRAMKRHGAAVAAVYAELGERGASLVAAAAADEGVKVRILPQPSSPGEAVTLALSWHGLGLDTPLQLEYIPGILGGNVLVHVHVSEDPALRGAGDVYMLRGERLAAIHLTHLTEGEVVELAREGVAPVFCPRSNLFFQGVTPPLRALVPLYEEQLPAGLGTDNAAWIPPGVDVEMAYAYMAARVEVEPGLRGLLARAILYAATTGCEEVVGLENRYILLLRLPELGFTADPVTTIVKRSWEGELTLLPRPGR